MGRVVFSLLDVLVLVFALLALAVLDLLATVVLKCTVLIRA